jgi:MscS family membrane protein
MQVVLDYYDRGATADYPTLDRASATLHVEGVDHVLRSHFLMRDRLVRILDRIDLADPVLAPPFATASEVAQLDAWTWRLVDAPAPLDQIALGFERMPGGGWLIDSATVARIEPMYEAVKSMRRVSDATPRPMTIAEWLRSVVPQRAQGRGFLLEPYQWIGLLVLFALAFAIGRVIKLFLRPLIRKLTRFQGVTLKDELLQSFERPFGWLLLALLFMGGIKALDLPANVYLVLRVAAGLFMTAAGALAAYRLVDVVCWPLQVKADRTESKLDDMLVPLLRRTLKVVIVLVGVVFGISRITGDTYHVLAGLSIGSLAVGFAAKDSIENLFGTFTVLLDSPFKIGDVVKFADFEGTVEEVGFRSTRIRTPEDSVISVPNSKFIGNYVDNLGLRRVRRIKIGLQLEYATAPETIEAFCEGVRELVRAHPLTANENYHVWLGGFSASALDVEVICYVRALDYATYTRERHRLFLDILRLARELGVSFAFPTQTVVQAQEGVVDHRDAPATSEEALARGRAAAQQLAAVSVLKFKQAPPPPVRFTPDGPDAIGR